MAALLAIYRTDTAVVWKLVRFTWHGHLTPDDDIQLGDFKAILNFNFQWF